MIRTVAIARSELLPRDTSIKSFHVQMSALRRLGEAGRARAAMELSDSVRSAAEAGVRLRHPDYDARTVRLAATRIMLGNELFRLAVPGVEVQP
jgi:hypothetical protein